MGTYLNPGKTAYQMAVNSEIFVDKTKMIQYLNSIINTQQRFVSVSRPRRFGKTMAADMICAYYDREADSRKLFEERKLIECPSVYVGEQEINWDTYLGQFNVLRILMTDFMEDCETVKDMIKYLTEEVTEELLSAYPEIQVNGKVTLRSVMSKIFWKTKRQFVIVIDEWDAIFRERQDDKDGQEAYIDFLRNWLKNKDYVALAYMTGILPIKKYGEHSALNMFTEYSMLAPRQLAPYTGLTEEEVKEHCVKYNMSYDEVSNWYDGYLISDRIPTEEREAYRHGRYNGHRLHIYNPLSVVEAMITGVVANYWTKTETYEALSEYINKNYDGLKDTVALLMNGGKIKVNTSSYQNDMTTFNSRDDILTLLIHLGYLGYDNETEEVFIPNKEILDEFKTSTSSSEWADAFKLVEDSQEILKAVWALDEDKVANLLEKAHDKAENKKYNDEVTLSYAIQLAFYAAKIYYTTIPELDSGKGYADIVYIPAPKYSHLPVLLVELKFDKTVNTALEQIKKRNYPDRLEQYKGNILLVCIEYNKDVPNTSPKFKHHTCKIEKA